MPKPAKATVAPPQDPPAAPVKAAPKGRAATKSPAGKATERPAGKATKGSAKATPTGRVSSRTAKAKNAPKTTRSAVTTTDRFFDEQRALLLAEREASMRQADTLRAEAAQLAEDMEPGDTQFDEESGEGATLNVERERDLALSAQALSAVDDVDRALAKLDAGTYGTCEQCGQPIPKARLKALPSATLCVACKSGGLSRR